MTFTLKENVKKFCQLTPDGDNLQWLQNELIVD